MARFNVDAVFKIGNSTGYFDDFEIATSAEAHLIGSVCKEGSNVWRECEQFLDFSARYISVVFNATFVSMKLIRFRYFYGTDRCLML